ncbi:hypothetical protein B0H13DRAFT_1892752 [Mycena leptocephala]|nr:hypothetical protein B0H13DRAFT_1892752 [Mycena leptocephala]
MQSQNPSHYRVKTRRVVDGKKRKLVQLSQPPGTGTSSPVEQWNSPPNKGKQKSSSTTGTRSKGVFFLKIAVTFNCSTWSLIQKTILRQNLIHRIYPSSPSMHLSIHGVSLLVSIWTRKGIVNRIGGNSQRDLVLLAGAESATYRRAGVGLPITRARPVHEDEAVVVQTMSGWWQRRAKNREQKSQQSMRRAVLYWLKMGQNLNNLLDTFGSG